MCEWIICYEWKLKEGKDKVNDKNIKHCIVQMTGEMDICMRIRHTV